MKKIWLILMLMLGNSTLLLSQYCHVGDVITNPDGSKGVVFYVNPDGMGGWMVALNDASSSVKWGNNGHVPNLPTGLTSASINLLNQVDGYDFTQAIRANGNNAAYPAAYAVDFDNGWYVPAIGQLRILISKLGLIESVITANGGTTLSADYYWSSSESNNNNAWTVCMRNPSGTGTNLTNNPWSGCFYAVGKSQYFAVRAVRDFTIPSYLWSTGETTQEITVAPTETTTYTVEASYFGSCGASANVTITVHHGTHNVEDVAACESYTWHEQEYTENGTYVYEYINENGCASADTLHLTINYGTHNVETITECESYTWHEQSYTQSGTYVYPYTNASGCQSADTLHLTINYGTHNVETITECESYTWHEQEYTQSGTYVYPYTNASGCASADTLHLTINYGTHLVETITECESYTWHNQEYTQSGIYIYQYTNALGCASADTLHLTINYGTHNVETITECESYTWHEQEYTQSGTYIYPYTNAFGCASADTLHLTINYGTHNVETITECESYTWHEQEYTQSGSYVYSYTNALGCASADTLHLTINYGTHNVETITECESYTWHEQAYTQSGTYVYSYTNALGCASADTLHLTINYGTHNVETITECESYTWHEQEYTQSGTYVYPYTNALGCASADTLHLTINYGTHNVETVTECESYTWHEQEYTQSGTYVYPYTNAVGCASADTLHLTISNVVIYNQYEVECEQFTWVNGETYTESVDGVQFTFPGASSHGCDSIVTLHLTINYGTHNVETITECESYTWHEQEYTQSGTYVYPYTNALGCASADTLHLTINYGTHNVETITECESYTWHEQEYTQSGTYIYPYTNAFGCASADTLHLTINYGTHNVETITECESYTWHEQEYTQSGSYVYSYTNALGCASADTLHLTINYGTHNVETITECESYTWHEQAYTQSGTYVYTYTNASGCASADTLHLTINYGTHNVETITECESYTWHEQEYTQSGTYVYPYTNASGCASADTLYLTINYGTHNVETITECESYTWHEQEYTQSGTYVYPYMNASGCQSADTLHLTINYGTHNVETITECESYTWHEQEYTQSGTYVYTYTNASGCASADTLHLTINYGTHNVETITECESYTWHEQEYTQSGTYIYPYTNAFGCASADTLHLTINYGTHNVETITECESYTWHEQEYTQSGTYVYPYTNAVGCASADTLHLTISNVVIYNQYEVECEQFTWVNGETYTESVDGVQFTFPGASSHGCDSIVTLHLTINYGTHNVETITECESYTWHEQEYTQSGTYVYPYTNAFGCASADTLHLTINYGTHNVETITECESYTWHEQEYTQSGTYVYPYTNASGCASADTLHLTINYGTHNVETITECESYTWHEQEYTQSGTYVYPYTNTSGCASADTLHLTINYGTHNVETITECESYTWHEQEYTQSGTYIYPYTNALGCASADTLHLTINYGTHNVETITECESYTWHEQSYAQSGTYVYPYTNASGCASADTLHLTINYGTHNVETITECESYTWHEQEYTQSGTYVYPYTNALGCASADTLHLTINYGTHNVETITECESYTWHEQEYTQSGTYVYSYTNALGCASADTLHLTINYGTHNVETITECESYTWHEQEYTQSGTYVYPYTNASGCQSADTLHLTINTSISNNLTITTCESYTWEEGDGATYTESGQYIYEHDDPNGCLQIDTLFLTINNAISNNLTITTCESYTWEEGDGATYTESGQYIYEHDDPSGCLQIDTLFLTINNAISNNLTITTCDSYTWEEGDGATYIESGQYIYEHDDPNGCLQIDTLFLTINNAISNNLTITTCESYKWEEGDGATYTESGQYIYEHDDPNGCLQIDTLFLTINNAISNNLTITTCDSYIWEEGDGATYTESGQYIYEHDDPSGCLQIDTLFLTINNAISNNLTITTCDSYTWEEGDGATYIESGQYIYEHDDPNGCLQIDTLFLTINNAISNNLTITTCESYTWEEGDGATYTESGQYIYEHDDPNGCLQIDTLFLTINNALINTITDAICTGSDYIENGFNIINPPIGIVYDTLYLTSMNDCDSLVCLELTVNDMITTEITDAICAGYDYTENGFNIINPPIGIVYDTLYLTSMNDCDSLVCLELTVNPTLEGDDYATICYDQLPYTWQSVTFEEAGTQDIHLTSVVTECDSLVHLHLIVNPLPTANAGDDFNIPYNSVTILIAEEVENAEYYWTPEELIAEGQGTAFAQTITLTETTTFYLTVTLDGCENTDEVTVIVGDALYATASAEPESVCPNETSTLSVTAFGGSGDLTYFWEPADLIDGDNTMPEVTTTELSDTSEFSCTVTDESGASCTAPVTVIVKPLPTANAGNDFNIAYNAQATLAAEQIEGAEYHWEPTEYIDGDPDQQIVTTVALDTTTTFTLTVTLDGCSNEDDVTVIVGDELYATASAEPENICTNETSTLSVTAFGGSGDLTYFWEPADLIDGDNTMPEVTTTELSDTSEFSCTVTDESGASYIATVTVTVKPLPIANAGDDFNIAYNAQATLAAEAVEGAEYHWEPVDYIDGDPDQQIVTTVALETTTTFTLTVTLDGCSNEDEVTVIVGDELYATASAEPESVCPNETSTLSVTAFGGMGELTYFWEPADLIDGDNTMPEVTTTELSDSSEFSCTVTDESGASYTAIVTVIVKPLPTANAGEDFNIAYNAQATLAAEAVEGAEYHWEPTEYIDGDPDQQIVTTVALETTTTFTLTVTLDGCSNEDEVTVIVGDELYATASAEPESVCPNETTTLSVTAFGGMGELIYLWEPAGLINGDNTLQEVTTTELSDTSEFSCTVTDESGASYIATVTVTVKPLPTANAGDDFNIAYNAQATLVAEAVEGAEYHWEPVEYIAGDPDQQIVTTIALETTQTFTLTVILDGCSNEDEVTVVVSDELYATASADPESVCPNETSTLSVTAFGGSGDLTYFWEPADLIDGDNTMPEVTTTELSDTSEFSCTVIDESGSSYTATVTVTVKPLPTANAGDDFNIAYNAKATLVAEPVENAEYHWSPEELIAEGQGTASAQTVALTDTTTFYLTVTLDGCDNTDEVTVSVIIDELYASVSAESESLCPDETTTLKVTPIGGTGVYTYHWEPENFIDGDNTTQEVSTTVLTGNTEFSCTVSDNAGDIRTVNITINYIPHLEFTSNIIGDSLVPISTNPLYNEHVYTISPIENCDDNCYTWRIIDNNDWQLIPDGNTCTLITSSQGEYELEVSVENDCGRDYRRKLIKGVMFPGGWPNTYVFPNPAKDYIEVWSINITSVVIVNSVGMEIKKLEFEGNERVRIDITDLAQGMYMIFVENSFGRKYRRLIVER